MRSAAAFILCAAVAALAQARAAGRASFVSPTYTIDRIYKSMLGPGTLKRVTIGDPKRRELVWIKSVSTEIVDADGRTPQKKEFMCHINVDANLGLHKRLFHWKKNASERLFTLSQGQFTIKFPEGFALPVMSDEPLSLFTQVLNHNYEHGKFLVRHKVSVDYVYDRDLKTPMKPLFATSAFVMALIEGKDGFFSQDKPSKLTEHASCQPGAHAPGATMGLYQDPFGRKLTGHWVVKPGREVKHTLVTKIMDLPFDSTLHYAVAHLHPFAESLELRDLTSGKTIFKTGVRAFDRGIGIAGIDELSSPEGIPLFKDHEYELVSVYNNTSDRDQDAMASVFLYLLDKEFKKPTN